MGVRGGAAQARLQISDGMSPFGFVAGFVSGGGGRGGRGAVVAGGGGVR